jgi:hypothetical protein
MLFIAQKSTIVNTYNFILNTSLWHTFRERRGMVISGYEMSYLHNFTSQIIFVSARREHYGQQDVKNCTERIWKLHCLR